MLKKIKFSRVFLRKIKRDGEKENRESELQIVQDGSKFNLAEESH
jgi:hypothetical protein